MRIQRGYWSVLVATTFLGCAGASPEPATSDGLAPASRQQAPAPGASTPTTNPSTPATADVTSSGTAEGAATADASGGPAPSGAQQPSDAPQADAREAETNPERNIRYIVSPEGLRVEVDGVSFSPKAERIQVGKGTGVKLRVDVRAKDGKQHSLLAPEKSPFAFAGTVRRGGQEERFSDQRDGDRAISVGDKPVTLTRSWPPAGVKPLESGDELELLVGVWGLGVDESSRRPLKKFCKITLKLDKKNPRVILAAPDGVGR